MLLPFNVFLFFLYLVTLSVFIFFYYPAIRQRGLLKLRKFTEIMLLVFGCAFFFSRFVPADMIYKLPLRVLLVLGGAEYATYLVIMVMIFFVYAAINIHKEEKPKLLISAWLAIALLNVGDILLNAYYYNTWNSPDVSENASFVDVAMEHALVQISYLYQMIYPACWVIVCCISLIKIIRNSSVETA